MRKSLSDMNLNELFQYQAWLYTRIEYLQYQKRVAKHDSKWFQQAGVNALYIEDELKKLEKIRKELTRQIQVKQRRK